MISTSYGVRFFERAYLMLTLSQLLQKAASCAWTSWRADVFRRKS